MPLVDDLRGILGPDRVKDSPLERRLYNRDAGVTPGTVLAVAFPETTQETAAVVRAARQWNVPVVPRGAGTGLATVARICSDPGGTYIQTKRF